MSLSTSAKCARPRLFEVASRAHSQQHPVHFLSVPDTYFHRRWTWFCAGLPRVCVFLSYTASVLTAQVIDAAMWEARKKTISQFDHMYFMALNQAHTHHPDAAASARTRHVCPMCHVGHLGRDLARSRPRSRRTRSSTRRARGTSRGSSITRARRISKCRSGTSTARRVSAYLRRPI